MGELTPSNRSAIGPLQAVMIVLVGVTVAGSSLLLSAASSTSLVDGAIEWNMESPLRAIVQLLCLNYAFPTTYAGDVKMYVLGIGAGLSALALSIAISVGSRVREADSPPNASFAGPSSTTPPDKNAAPEKTHVAPLIAAQVLVVLYLLWSFASSRWSAAADLAIGGSLLLVIQFLWAFCIGHGLNPRAARVAAKVVIGVTTVTSLVALWYYYGRNPTLRAKFPFGNPNFLAACLLPGILLIVTSVCHQVAVAVRTRSGRAAGWVVLPAAALALAGWVLWLSGSRGPLLGLAMGGAAMAFFVLPRRLRVVPVAAAVLMLVGAGLYFSSIQNQSSPTGRDATIRFRMYAWSYAWNMFEEKPFTGHGQGGFVLKGDAQAVGDVMNDPEVFESRIAHAHNEWLEIMADLGAVGIVLFAAVLLLTLRAGMLALGNPQSPEQRWLLLGLLSALVALVGAESFGVGLRVSGVPTMFYTVLGLIWALCNGGRPGLTARLSATRNRRVVTGLVGGLAGLATLAISHRDFLDARHAFGADEYLRQAKYEEAVAAAAAATNRLNPQRALENLHRLSEAHMLTARKLQERAIQRERRAAQGDLPDPRRVALAQEDRRLSDNHCHSGSAHLKALLKRSPGYFNQGWVSYWLNIIQAGNAGARNDPEQRDRFLAAAGAALERELQRQPFNPQIAVGYAQVVLGRVELSTVVEVLARPLRYHRIIGPLVDLLRNLPNDPQFRQQFSTILAEAGDRATVLRDSGLAVGPVNPDSTEDDWLPEKLRIAGAVRFLARDYVGAREALELAASGYERLTGGTKLGAPSCYAELADARFQSDPEDPQAALDSAKRAIALAPRSEPGRHLQASVKQRMVDYYLAAGEEENARRLLRETAPAGSSDAAVLRQLGYRYRQLATSLLLRETGAGGMSQPPTSLLAKLQAWVSRSMELEQSDAATKYLAAELALYARDCERVASYLLQALEAGLSNREASLFLKAVGSRNLKCRALDELADSLNRPSEGVP